MEELNGIRHIMELYEIKFKYIQFSFYIEPDEYKFAYIKACN